MKILFLTFTPYHVKVSNYLAKSKYNNCEKMIITTDFNHTRSNILKEFIEQNLYNHIEQYDYNISTIEILKHFYKSKKYLNLEANKFIETCINFNPDKIIYFSDNPPIYQMLLKKVGIECEKILVEEGIGIYIEERKISYRAIFVHYLNKVLYDDKSFNLFIYGKGGYENSILAREPELVSSQCKNKVKLSRLDMINILADNTNKYTDGEVLFCPACTIYNPKKMIKIYRDVFEYYLSKGKQIYVKLHPSEKYTNLISNLIQEYKNVTLIRDKNITSETIVLQKNINTVVSDYSSTLINAYYIRENIELVSYYGMMQKKYNIDINFKSTLFRYLIENGCIKSFENYKINV